MKYRNLTENEIVQLEKQLCTSDNWKKLLVADPFTPNSIINSHFLGDIKIGRQERKFEFFGGIKKPSGIFNSTLHNVEIGDNCYINNIKSYISNYSIGDNVVIDNVQIIATEGESYFGQGKKIAVLDESGGRKIMMIDNLSAQLAYIMTLYRYRPALITILEQIISAYAESKKSKRGYIGDYSWLTNTGSLKNVWIGNNANIDGVRTLENGTIVSNEYAPVTVGNNVILKNFIVQSGTSISDGVILNACFVGQGCELGKNYSAENSVFFANCQGFHGEACSIFAGPFTVTHHKSTLLIAGMYSFLNAGSGSNQSNHMYKLGPIHQGIVERGSKTTSDSYLLWPAKIGPFTLVMGRHYKNSDTSDMPFSYLIERGDKTWLAPGVNLRSIGTIRDAMKWPKRDNRKDPNKIDCINFNLLSPFTIQKMVKAIEILENLKKVSGQTSDEFIYNNTSISHSALSKGIQLYNIGIDKFLGNSVITRLYKANLKNEEDLISRLCPDSEIGKGEWVDLSGLIAPKNGINNILEAIENGTLVELCEIQQQFMNLHESYYDIEWNWAVSLLEWRLKKPIEQVSITDIMGIVAQWKKSVIELDHMLYEDARKEFQLSAMTGFGNDGDMETRQADFEMVRGNFDNNSFVQEIKQHIDKKSKLGDRMMNELRDCYSSNIQ
jgi:acetyltransferase-like isoleucine patch superfamily enzyme